MKPTVILTVGHGTASQDEFVELVRTAGVETVVDVRRYPGSRRHPHFGRDEMTRWLPDAGVAYHWLPVLGGRRGRSPTSPNIALRNEQFRAYADYMATAEFRGGLDALQELGAEARVAIICAESVWWRCHRRLVSDYLVLIAEVDVEHLFHDGRRAAHAPSPSARVADGQLVYDQTGEAGPSQLPLL